MNTSNIKKVCVIGLGYIGLPTAAIVASRGIKVVGVDINDHVIETINRGGIHIVEPGLDVVVRGVVSTGQLCATKKMEHSNVYVIAVPTPFKDGHVPDLSYVNAAATSISKVVEKGDLIILESTSPVGTTEKMRDLLSIARKDLSFANSAKNECDVYIAYCPERVLPGHVLKELIQNDRVIGGVNQASAEKARDFYKCFVEGECIITNAKTAEMTKLTENSFRDVNIAFANELSMLCDQFGISVWELISLANRHPRVNILQPGPGVGGHCISVDPWFLVHQSPEYAKLIHTARIVNDSKPDFVLSKINSEVEKFKFPTVAFFGLSFKANIDDLRESPAMEIIEAFAKQKNSKVLAVEPYVEALPVNLGDLQVEKESIENALQRADILVLLVDHNDFKNIDISKFKSKIIVDTRGVWA